MEKPSAPAVPQVGQPAIELIFAYNPHPMWVFDEQTHAFLAVNDAALAHYGYTREEFLHMTLADIRPPEDVPSLAAHLEIPRALRRRDGVWRHRSKGGHCFYARITSHDVIYGGRNATLIMAEDVSEQVAAAEALQESEERFRTLFESMAQGVVYQDVAGYIFSANPAAERILGLSLDQLQGRSSIDPRWRAIHPDGQDFPGEEHPAMVALRTGQPVHDVVMGIYNPQEDSYRWLSVNAAPQFRPGEDIPYQVFATFDDITIRVDFERMLEARVAERTAELRRALQVKDQFMAAMSHELRTPLQAILAFTEMLIDEHYAPVTERQRTALRKIDLSGRRLLQLIEDILDFSGLEAATLELRCESFGVEAVCREAAAMIRQAAQRKHIDLRLALPRDLTISADPQRLRQILLNLLDNAVKFTPADGMVELRVTPDPSRQVVEFAVTDTGAGIPPEEWERIFEPFVQLDTGLARAYDGTGLGLPIVQRLVALHGGSITVTSTPGEGSRFTVTLPWHGA
jgi:PAS domain S-box-containing protein